MTRRCPHCHQHIAVERLGVRLTPLKARIFDAIKAAGYIGICRGEIVNGEVYGGRRRPAYETIKAHVWQINDLLAETVWVIESDGRRWYLRRRRMQRKAA